MLGYRLALAVALAAACTRPQPVPPEPDVVVVDAAGDPYLAACQNLARLGCSDVPRDGGTDAVQRCAAIMRRAQEGPQPLARFDLVCLATRETKEQARSCGGVDCF